VENPRLVCAKTKLEESMTSKPKVKLNRNRNFTRKAKRKSLTKPTRKSNQHPIAQADCPYRPGTLYGTLFGEGNKDYISKDELIKRVAETTGKSEKVVNFAYQVLKSPKHRSNKNRSTVIEEGGKIKLIPIRKNQ
jgi:hypothetical protein